MARAQSDGALPSGCRQPVGEQVPHRAGLAAEEAAEALELKDAEGVEPQSDSQQAAVAIETA